MAVVVILAADATAAASALAEPHVSILVELAFVGVVEIHEFGVLEVGHQFLDQGGGEAAFLELGAGGRRGGGKGVMGRDSDKLFLQQRQRLCEQRHKLPSPPLKKKDMHNSPI